MDTKGQQKVYIHNTQIPLLKKVGSDITRLLLITTLVVFQQSRRFTVFILRTAPITTTLIS